MNRLTFADNGPVRGKRIDINIDGKRVGQIVKTTQSGYYWYCRTDTVFVNTAGKPPMTFDECKAAAKLALKKGKSK